jgi:cytochrome c-type biogenesis protein CcmH
MSNLKLRAIFGSVFFLVLFAALIPVGAQGGGTTVTDDQVNNVARKLYCPVCENIPLDVCGTAACKEWREEIRTQLSNGRTEQQVIDDFVQRFGDRVVGTPQDPILRTLSLVTPWVISGLVLLAAVIVFVRWRLAQAESPEVEVSLAPEKAAMSMDEYRARLERDLAKRR